MRYRRTTALLFAALLAASSLSAEPHNKNGLAESGLDALAGKAELALSPILGVQGTRAESRLDMTVINLAAGPVQVASRLLGTDGVPVESYRLALESRKAVLGQAAKARLANAEDLRFRLEAPDLPDGEYFLVIQVADPRTGIAATSTTSIRVDGEGLIRVEGDALEPGSDRIARLNKPAR